jgi:hypothetical protein
MARLTTWDVDSRCAVSELARHPELVDGIDKDSRHS